MGSKFGRLAKLIAVAAVLAVALPYAAAYAQDTAGQAPVQRTASLQIPGNPLKFFDISVVDGDVYALSDRSNKGVDLFDAKDNRFLGRAGGFTGLPGPGGSGGPGPNGLAAVGPQQIWAGDGGSRVKIIDIKSHKVIDTISTGGSNRVDELAYDPRGHLVIAANNADQPPFLSFISTTGTHKVLGRLVLPQASDGIEQPVWDAASGLFYVPVPELGGHPAQGGIAVVDPRTHQLLRTIQVTKCVPTGLALGQSQQLLVGCSDDAIAAGFAAKSMLMDLPSGKITRVFHQVGGSDEVWYDRAQDEFFLAAVANPGGPVLGIIDARQESWVGNVPTGPHAHSVAVDGAADKIFVPIAAGPGTQCNSGCIAVFSRPG